MQIVGMLGMAQLQYLLKTAVGYGDDIGESNTH